MLHAQAEYNNKHSLVDLFTRGSLEEVYELPNNMGI